MKFPSFFKKKSKIKSPPTQPVTAQPQPSLKAQQETLARGLTSIQDIIAPPSIDVDFTHIKIGQIYFRTLFVAGYPRFVNANWLAPLINFDHSLDIAMYIYPAEGKGILEDLKRKIGEMEAEIQTDIQRGRIANIETQVKLEDARALQKQLAKGAERFFQFGLYITIPAKDEKELETTTKQVQSTLGSLLIVSKITTLQMEDAFKTVLPTCQDKLQINRNMDTTSLATTFPFTSSELTANKGIMYGINEHNDSLIIFDRFSLENSNMVLFAKSGSGKSIDYNSQILIQNSSGEVEKTKIGPLIDQLITNQDSIKIDQEMEGIINPKIKVFTFDKKLKAKWAKVTIAARKKTPKTMYCFTTASGRQITTTGDHNLITLNSGKLQIKAGRKTKISDVIPIPRKLISFQKNKTLNLLTLLKDQQNIYVIGAEKILKPYASVLKKPPIDKKFDRYLYLYLQNRSMPLVYFLKIIKRLNLPEQKLKTLKVGSRLKKGGLHLPAFFPVTKSLVRIIGYVVAEGCTTSNYISISATSPEIRQDIHKCFQKLKLNSYPTKTSINCGARVFVALVKALKGASQKSGRKFIPPALFDISPKITAHFLQAYFSGDGTVNNHEVSACSKSKKLISDLSYLLLYFGIISRIHKKFKRATNSSHKGNYYHQITISGQKNISLFAKNISFTVKEKAQKLKGLLKKTGNTNVDTIPTLAPLFEKLHQLLFNFSRISPGPSFISIKNGGYNPSRKELLKHIAMCRKRIKQVQSEQNKINFLASLPSIDYLIQKGKQKPYNTMLWNSLGQTWRVIKKKQVRPQVSTVLRAYKTITGETFTAEEIISWTQESYQATGVSLWKHNKNLSPYQTNRKSNTLYQYIYDAGQHLIKEYRLLQSKIEQAKQILKHLKKLAASDLFWDPIVNIKTFSSKHPYVYDLQVDNGTFVAGHGGLFVHNSYMVKLEVIRSLLFDTEIIILDPESEYKTLCEAMGGEYISFSFNSLSKINPFDLSQVYEEGENELGLKILSLHSLFKIIMRQMTPEEEAILDRALVLTYKQKGITPDPKTQKNEPPLLEDLYKVLIGMEEPQSSSLAARLEKFIKGSLRGIFDQRSTVSIANPLTVFSIKELEDELRPIAMFIILDFIWTKIKKDLKKRLLVVDEAWYLMKHPNSATFLYSMVKRARKYYLGVTTITQDVEDFLASDYGKAIITNSSIQVLMKQSSAAIDKIGQVFYLSQGEKNLLLAAGIGEGLFFAGANHAAIKVVASPEEHDLITSNPEELLAMRQRKQALIEASKAQKTQPAQSPAKPTTQPTQPAQPLVSYAPPLQPK